jgi:hypothetical protein
MVTVPLPLASATALAFDGPAPRWHENAKGTQDPQKSARITANDVEPDPACAAATRAGASAGPGSGWKPRTMRCRRRHRWKPEAGREARCAQEHAIAHGDGSMRRLSGFCDGVTDA